MSYLTIDADQMVRHAVDAFLEGRLRADVRGDCVYATRNSQYRIVEGVVQEATDTSLMGVELVGWLVEEAGRPGIEPDWRPYARAVLVERSSRHVVVTSRTLTRQGVGGHQPPKPPKQQRKPSVIPNAPPIPVLKSQTPPPGTLPRLPPPRQRHPEDESTVAADRKSYESLVEESRTPVRLPPPKAPPKRPEAPRRNASTLMGIAPTGDEVDTAVDVSPLGDDD